MIFKILLKLYIRKNRDIMKISENEEQKLFLFKNPNDIEKLIRSFLTVQTIKHFEENDTQLKDYYKGAAIVLKVLRDGHQMALESYDKDDEEKNLSRWQKIKKNNPFKKYFIY